jgi:hypothetical protein
VHIFGLNSAFIVHTKRCRTGLIFVHIFLILTDPLDEAKVKVNRDVKNFSFCGILFSRLDQFLQFLFETLEYITLKFQRDHFVTISAATARREHPSQKRDDDDDDILLGTKPCGHL